MSDVDAKRSHVAIAAAILAAIAASRSRCRASRISALYGRVHVRPTPSR